MMLRSVAVLAIALCARLADAQGLPVYMSVVGHADDDFLFMNPELGNQIAAGFPSITVFLTAGEAEGGATPGEDRAQFTRARQRGALSVHAQLAGVANAWTRSVQAPDGVHLVEVYTLDAAPRIELVFLSLHEGYDPLETPKLANLLIDPTAVAITIVPACVPGEACYSSPLPQQQYTRAGVIAVLQALIAAHQPTVFNAQDPQPWVTIPEGSIDHPDHRTGARFLDLVLAGYHGPNGTRRFTVTHFKGYSFLDFPPNLGPADHAEKQTTAVDYYLPFDSNYQAYRDAYLGYYGRQWERYPGSTTWLERAADGRLVAATVQDRQVLTWHEGSPGGIWIGPIRVPGVTPLSPHLTLLRRPDGLLQLFALRLPLERETGIDDPNAPRQEVVTALQVAGASYIYFDPWSVVGTPDPGCTVECQFAGVQTAAIDGAGRTFVFAKDSAGFVRWARSSGIGWTSFASLGGADADIIDGIAAQTRGDGRVEAFATSRAGNVIHLIEDLATGTMTRETASFLGLSGVASAPTITKNQDGRPEIFYREADTGRVLTVWDTGGGTWAGPTLLYGDAGVGPVSALLRPASGHIMLFERNVWQGISSTWQQAPNDVFYLQWAILGGFLNEYPSAASDSAGRAVVAVKGGDGRLYYRRETGAIGSFADWAAIVGPCETFDPDMDGVCSTIDNCPNAANTGQQEADGNGVGDACECGDFDASNHVDALDVAKIRARLADIPQILPLSSASRCSVIGTSTDCDMRDVAVLRRTLHSAGAGPGISAVCSAANTF